MSKVWKWRNKKGKLRKFYIGFDFIDSKMGCKTIGLTHRTNRMFESIFRAHWIEIHFWFGKLIFHFMRQQ